jgi:hypothetical protein
MTCRARILAPLFIAAALLALAAPGLAAPKSKGGRDLVTLSPDFAAAGVHRIALLPVCTFGRDVRAQVMVAAYWGQNFKDIGYRWISPTTCRELVPDSTLNVACAGMLKTGRVDSLLAPLLCRDLRTNAVLAARIDQWEQNQLNWDQPGKPSTTVRLAAALVDSSGALLWSISGGETLEGPYHDPALNPPEIVNHPTMATTPMTGENGPPRFEDVLSKLLARWAPQFPKPAAAEAAK